MYSILYYCRQLTDNYVYGRSSSRPLLILTKNIMNENSYPEMLITIIILSVLLAILSVTTAFCHTERSAGYKNKVNIGKKKSNNNLPDIFCFAYDSNTAF